MEKFGAANICGCDEVGRGAFFGSLCAAAVVLTPSARSLPIKDSKKLSEAQRHRTYDMIMDHCVAYATRLIPAEEIDDLGISAANRRAMQECISEVTGKVPDCMTVIDGERIWVASDLPVPHVFEVDGDAKSLAVAAASIIAKVTRDDLMIRFGDVYPQYGFERHKGYGSKEHEQAIIDHGIIPGLHRMSFIKRLIRDNELRYNGDPEEASDDC